MIRSDYDKVLDNILFKYQKSKAYSFLVEGINELQPYYPKLDLEQIKKLVALDPTYKGGDSVGKYGRWIIGLYYNNVKNNERLVKYNQFRTRPENRGKEITPPQMLPAIKDEDLYKVTDALKKYDTLQNKIKKPVTDFKTLPDLEMTVQQYEEQGVPTDAKALKIYNVFKKCETLGLKKIFENSRAMIGIPETKASSVPFGEFTSWCTTTQRSNYYERYSRQGPLFIIFIKDKGDLYQFHFETASYMNAADRRIDMKEFTQNYKDVCLTLYNYVKKQKGITNSEDLSGQVQFIKNYYENVISSPNNVKIVLDDPSVYDVKIEDGAVSASLDLRDVRGNVYEASGRDVVRYDDLMDILEGTWDRWDWESTSALEDEWEAKRIFDEVFKENGLDLRFDDIVEDDVPEEFQEIINEDFSEWVGLRDFISYCYRSGTENAMYKDVREFFADNFPIKEFFGDTKVRIGFTKEEFYKIVWEWCCQMKGWTNTWGKDDSIPFMSLDKLTSLKGEVIESKHLPTEWWVTIQSEDANESMGGVSWINVWRQTRGMDEDEVFREPYGGYYEFDGEYFKEGCKEAVKKCKEKLENK